MFLHQRSIEIKSRQARSGGRTRPSGEDLGNRAEIGEEVKLIEPEKFASLRRPGTS